MTKRNAPWYAAAALILGLSACIPLPIMQDNEEPANLPYGPQISAQEQQTEVYESLMSLLQQSYIHYEEVSVDWAALKQNGLERIDAGMSTDEFNAMLDELETKLPNGDFEHQSRSEILQLISDSNPSGYGGIGAFVDFKPQGTPHVVILDVMPGSPAEKAGLQAHDSIYAIDGTPVGLEEGLGAVSRVRGPIGTQVTLSIETPGVGRRDVNVTRAQISGVGALRAQLFEGSVGYILLPPAPNATTIPEIKTELEKYAAIPGFKGLILDLRISNSSSNWPVDELLTLFQNGTIGEVRNPAQIQSITITGSDVAGSQTVPLVVLVDDHTAGLPELFAAAMQINNRATIIGAHTSGRVETLNGFMLPNGAQVFIAGTSFRLIDGQDVGMDGVSPKVVIEAGWDEIQAGHDPVILAAVQFLNKAQP